MVEIREHAVYTTEEARALLKVSPSTIKRLLRRSMLRANKVGRQYRILGKEILRLVSPSVERSAVAAYQHVKRRTKRRTSDW